VPEGHFLLLGLKFSHDALAVLTGQLLLALLLCDSIILCGLWTEQFSEHFMDLGIPELLQH